MITAYVRIKMHGFQRHFSRKQYLSSFLNTYIPNNAKKCGTMDLTHAIRIHEGETVCQLSITKLTTADTKLPSFIHDPKHHQTSQNSTSFPTYTFLAPSMYFKCTQTLNTKIARLLKGITISELFIAVKRPPNPPIVCLLELVLILKI